MRANNAPPATDEHVVLSKRDKARRRCCSARASPDEQSRPRWTLSSIAASERAAAMTDTPGRVDDLPRAQPQISVLIEEET
jgi:hypothetical protein